MIRRTSVRKPQLVALLVAAMLAVADRGLRQLHRRARVAADDLGQRRGVRDQRRAARRADARCTCSAARCCRRTRTSCFDVAFDIDASGNVVVLPQRAVASGLATTHTVALQTVTTSRSTRSASAPKSGYRADTALVTTVESASSSSRARTRTRAACRSPARRSTPRSSSAVDRVSAPADDQVHRRSELRLLLVRRRPPEGLIRARPASAPRAGRSASRRHAPARHARRARPGRSIAAWSSSANDGR